MSIISNLSPKTRRRALDSLSQHAEVLKQRPEALSLWRQVRIQLHRHQSHPDANWDMDTGEVRMLADIYKKLTPSDQVSASAWLFDGWHEFPNLVQAGQEPSDAELMDGQEQLQAAQQKAVRTIFEYGGTGPVVSLVENVRNPDQVGVAVALELDADLAISLSAQYAGSTMPNLRKLAHGIISVLFPQSGWEALDQILNQVRDSDVEPSRVAAIYLCPTADQNTWQRLGSEAPEVQDAYWNTVPAFYLPRQNPECMAIGVQKFIDAHRSLDVLEVLAFASVDAELTVKVLEQASYDIAKEIEAGHKPQVEDYVISRLFEKLDESCDIPDNVIARLEAQYIQALRHHRPSLKLHREVLKEPSLFAYLISIAFKRSDGQTDEAVDEQELHSRARLAYGILSGLRGLPGRREDGEVVPEVLVNWVNEARRLCNERDRREIGDIQIGKILANANIGADGVWPCESVRDLLDSIGSQHLGRGLITSKSNLRGVTLRGPFDGGELEHSLTRKYRADAEKITSKWPLTARFLRKLASNYDSVARMHDQWADWRDQFEA